MISPKERIKENKKLHPVPQKPSGGWFGPLYGGNPEQMGLHALKKKKKRVCR